MGLLRRWIIGAVLTGTIAAGGTLVLHHDASATEQPTVTTAVAPVSETIEETTVEDQIDVSAEARWSVAVLDTGTGRTTVFGDNAAQFDTASIVKVDILAALLVQQDGTLTDAQRSQAKAMITRSDNDSASTLYSAIGGASGLDAFNDSIGLTDTVADANGYWGLTQTTAEDQVRLLDAVLGVDSVLSDDAQDYVRGLMEQTIDSQRFGVTAAADDGDDGAVKVGYLQRSATGLWDVTSIGEVERDGHTYLVAVLTGDNLTFDAGVSLADELAAAAVDAAIG